MVYALDGCREKIGRAREHVRNLDAEITEFIESAPPTITVITKSDPATGGVRQSIVIDGPKIPLRLSVIAGEVVHQLRSSLDHLIWQLVVANGSHEPSRLLEFPVVRDSTNYASAAGQKLKGVRADAAELIESLQPYRPYEEGASIQDHPLLILHDLNIIDKHRFIIATGGELNFYESKDLLTWHPHQLDRQVVHRLGRTPTQPPDMSYRVSFDIVFQKFGSREGETVVPSLQQLCDFTSRAIDSFVPFFS